MAIIRPKMMRRISAGARVWTREAGAGSGMTVMSAAIRGKARVAQHDCVFDDAGLIRSERGCRVWVAGTPDRDVGTAMGATDPSGG